MRRFSGAEDRAAHVPNVRFRGVPISASVKKGESKVVKGAFYRRQLVDISDRISAQRRIPGAGACGPEEKQHRSVNVGQPSPEPAN